MLADGSVRYEDTTWAAVLRSPSSSMESIVALVCQSELKTKAGYSNVADLKSLAMAAARECLDITLSTTEDMLLSESLSESSHKLPSCITQLHTLMCIGL